MKKYCILKNSLITFLLINALFISVINVEPVLGDMNNPPMVSEIHDQKINEGDNFTLIYLDDYVEDDIDSDENITWSYSCNIELIVTIVDRVTIVSTPDVDWYGEETITFRATDTGDLFDEDNVTFNVSSMNDPPMITDIPDQSITKGSNFTSINLDDYIYDVDDSDADISWTYSGNTELNVSIVDRVATVTTPNVVWYGEETITFIAADTGGLFDEDHATFKVTTMNNPPKVTDILDQTINKGNNFTSINLDDYVEDDIDSDENITWSYSGNTELIVSIVDRIAIITTPNVDWYGEETITFTATDTGNLSDEDNAIFNVSSINGSSNNQNNPDPDVGETDVDLNADKSSEGGNPIGGSGAIWTTRNDCGSQQQNVNEYCPGEVVYINGANFDPNVELNWNITGLLNSCDPNTTVASGTNTSDDNGSFCFPAYTIKNDDCGEYRANVENKKDNFNVTICNYPPIANDDYATVMEGGTVTILDSGNNSVLDNDTDPDGDPLTAVLEIYPTHGLLILNSNGTFNYTHDGSETTFDSFVYNVSDSYGAYDHATVTITINPQNDAPILNQIGNQSVIEGSNLNLSLSAIDPENDGLTFTISDLPDFATFADNGDGSGWILFEPGFDDSGVYSINVTVTDDGDPVLYDFELFNLTVVNVNLPPEIIDDSDNITVGTGDTITLWVKATDNVLVASAEVSIDGGIAIAMSWNATPARWEYNYTAPTTDEDHTYELTVYDGEGLTDSSGPYDIVVPNDAPNTPIDPNPDDGKTGVDLNPVLSVNVSDPNGDVLNVSFYDNNHNLIGIDISVASGDNASIIWSDLSYSTTYYWYAVANDSEFKTESTTWSFTTKGAPAPPPPPPPSNKKPIADASAGEPYVGVVGEDITFDGSLSYDPDPGGYIVSWHWDFDDGTDEYGEIVTHNYSSPGKYHVILTVTDNDGATDKETFNVVIAIANNPPENLTVDGPLTGKQNVEYDYSASAIDLDVDDMLRFIFEWGDGTTTTSEVVDSGLIATVTHNWSSYGIYEVNVTALDNYSAQISTTFIVLIDVIVIDGEITGLIIDEDGNDPFDIFNNSETEAETVVELDNGSYLIDSDGDNEWDYAYNSETGLITYYEFVYQKYFIVYQVEKAAPGFELISILAVIALLVIVIKRKRKNK